MPVLRPSAELADRVGWIVNQRRPGPEAFRTEKPGTQVPDHVYVALLSYAQVTKMNGVPISSEQALFDRKLQRLRWITCQAEIYSPENTIVEC